MLKKMRQTIPEIILLATMIVIVIGVNPCVSHPVESTFRNLVCQQCNSWCLPQQQGVTEVPRIGKAGPRGPVGPVGPAGPAGIVNMTAVEALVDRKIDEAIGFLKIQSCEDVSVDAARSTNETGGVFDIANPNKFERMPVYCDLTTDGGKWTVFQRRMDGFVNFDRDWNDYVNGFGNANGDFWLGLDTIHQMTKKGIYELRIDMRQQGDTLLYARYSNFRVAAPSDNYRLTLVGYSGNASDCFSYHNNRAFSTKDRDLDNWSKNCATEHKGGWWYGACIHSTLNGILASTGWDGVICRDAANSYAKRNMDFTEMKFRKKQ